MDRFQLRRSAEVAVALDRAGPVVALESTLVAHGLPRPDNLQVARQVEQVVREHDAVPATIGMIGGELVVGLDDAELTHLASAGDIAKLSVRDLPMAAAAGADGATTVASTSAVAAAAGIEVFATGGLGGVHRAGPDAHASWDESADLTTLARTPVAVVCAGVKSILDVGATLERLETLGVSVAGYRTTRFPGFYVSDSGFPLDWSFDSPGQVAQALHARRAQHLHPAALVVANPLPTEVQLDPEWHDRVLADGLSKLAAEGITGKAVTPYLLSHFHAATSGRSLAVNIEIIRRNAALAARIAVALVAGGPEG